MKPCTRKMPTSHVQNVFCLAHQIITPTLDYSHLGCSSQLRALALFLSFATVLLMLNRNFIQTRDLLRAFFFLLNRIRFGHTKNIARESNVMKIKTCPFPFSILFLSFLSICDTPFGFLILSSHHSWPELMSNFPRYYEN